jgi:hypothetical protein
VRELHWAVPWLAAAALPAGALVVVVARRGMSHGRASLAWGAAVARGAAVALALVAAAGPTTVTTAPTRGVVYVAASDARNLDGADAVVRWPEHAADAPRAIETLRASLPSDRPGSLAVTWSAEHGTPPGIGTAAALRTRGADTSVVRPATLPAPRPVPAGARVTVPESVVQGVPFAVVLESGEFPFTGGIATVSIDGVAQEVPLLPGATRVVAPSAEVRAGTHVVAAQFPDRPATARSIRVAGPPSVLLVTTTGLEPPLAARLRAQGLEVTTVSDAAADLAPRADVVVLGPGSGARCAADVASRVAAGAGLLVMGGEGARGLSRLRGTALAPILPVEVPEPPAPPPPEPAPPPDDPRPPNPEAPKPVLDEGRKEALRVALLLCIDRSGSMSGVKMVMAREAAVAAARSLSPEDRIGVIAFDEEPEWIVPFQPARDMEAMYRRIQRLEADGGTNFHPALRIGFSEIARQPCGIRHVILVTDGATRAAVFRDMVEAASDRAITLSTVAVGDGADTHLLGLLAQWGRGRLYPAVDPERLPQVITIDTRRFVEAPRETAKEKMPVEDVVPPRADAEGRTPGAADPPQPPAPPPGPSPRSPRVAFATPFLAGLESEPWPALPHPEDLRPRTPATVPLTWDGGAAALALGRASGGRCAVLGADAFSSDARDVWTWPEGSRALAQLVRFLAPSPPPADAGPAVRFVALETGDVAVVVDAPGGGTLRIRPAGGGDEVRVVCEPAGDVCVGSLRQMPPAGIWVGEFAPERTTETLPVACGVGGPRPRDDTAIAADLAERSGARLVDELPEPRRGRDREQREDRRVPFLAAAAVFLVVEAALRRGVRG